MNCKPGDLAFIVRSNDARNIGKTVTVLRRFERVEASWYVVSSSLLHGVYSDWPAGAEVGQFDSHLKPIRDQPGNEKFVTELRDKLPRSKPATTKQDTINERGELA